MAFQKTLNRRLLKASEDGHTEIVKAQLVSLHLGRMKDDGTFTPQQV